MQWPDAAEAKSHFDSMLVVDRMALYLDGAFIVAGLLTLLFAPPYLREQGFEFGEFYALVLFAVAGMVMVAHATHMVSLLIGIETMSLAAYVLTGCWRKSLRSSEGAMKYFLMGAFATSFLVYGIALVYGRPAARCPTRASRPR
jgi:NADH-quinone oxidoreductase subunit N